MKTVKMITAAVTAMVMLGSLGSCMSFSVGNTYPNADKYTAGDRDFSEKVSSIEIDWSSGSIDVEYDDSNKVSVKETADKTLSESEQVHTWLDGETLRIQFCESGIVMTGDTGNKKLTVRIPKGTVLNTLDLDGASCEYTFDAIEAERIDVDVSSGAGTIKDCSVKTFELDSASGDLVMTQKGSSDSIDTDCASGSVTITADTVGTIDCDSSSGKINFTAAEAKSFNASTSSGTVTTTWGAVPESIDVDTASGDVSISFPRDPDFTANIDTATGDLDSSIALKKEGDNYISGSGKNKIEIDTSSGDITFRTAS